MGKPHDDLADVKFIHDDVGRFAAMSWDEYRAYIEKHPEDRLYWIDGPNGGVLHVSREATRRFEELAKRQRRVDQEKEAIGRVALNRAIRAEFVQTFLRNGMPVEQKHVDRMLARATTKAKQQHEAITHYLPCVFLVVDHPDEFHIGPVRFVTRKKFLADCRAEIESHFYADSVEQDAELARLIAEGKYPASQRLSGEKIAELGRETLSRIYDWYGAFYWVAEVAVPQCDARVSRERAEMTVQAALDILKLFFGGYGGRDFRLGHDPGKPRRSADLTRDVSGRFRWSTRSQIEGIPAAEGWLDVISNSGYIVETAGQAIETYLTADDPSELRSRWLGALSWYGQAVSERNVAAQLVKYVSALERLTVTEETGTDEVTDVVTRRTALLGVQKYEPPEVKAARDDARKLYRWRSDLVHGRESPLNKAVEDVIHLAHRIVQQSLFVALDMYVQLTVSGKLTDADLEAHFVELETDLGLVDDTPDPDAQALEEAIKELQAIEAAALAPDAVAHLNSAVAQISRVHKKLSR